MAGDTCWLIVALLLGFRWLVALWQRQRQPHVSSRAAQVTTLQRLLKPRTPDDCPACWRRRDLPPSGPAPPPWPLPWHEFTRRRSAPRRIATDGFACPNHACPYYRITDPQLHALVGDGTHGKAERIQPFGCQACGPTCTARRATPLYRLKRPAQRVGEVLPALAEGLDIAATERWFGHGHAPITTWLTRVSAHSATLHDRWFRHLAWRHLQPADLCRRLR